ncbi:GGDEF domain-containing protein [Pseudomonas sp. StFLB209]|uniref:GGDEF domain-containing protein n=1 Tax=Pseudomonas sp. StFLB209 TaxID=1028989 RepID=UPI0005ED6901|nr:GGDEF domain-containing protein [Pseudomonas sp. StFLB209]
MSSPPRIDPVVIDTSSVPRPSARPRLSVQEHPVDMRQLGYQLAQQLQTSLEADRILEMFCKGLTQAGLLDGLTYSHAASDLQLSFGDCTPPATRYDLSHAGEPLGQLELHHRHPLGAALGDDLQALVSCLLYPLRNALLYRMAIKSALRDPLTDTGNRVAMDQVLTREVDDSRRYRQPLSLLMLDIDHFKQINDTHGHVNGDQVLKSVAQTLKQQVRNVDRVFRYGGEEFVIILANTDREAAAMIGERLRQTVEALEVVGLDGLRPSISLGCATLLPAESVDSLLRRADSALYAAKREGRNRMMMAG